MKASDQERLTSLARYQILGTPQEESFDAITRLAAEICDAPYAAISFAEIERQWFKSEVGMKVRGSSLALSFCGQAIAQEEPLIIRDAMSDPRFRDSEYAAGSPVLRFYAGIQLRSSKGISLGVLCVLDVTARPDGLTSGQESALKVLANQVEAQLELRRVLNERDTQMLAVRQVKTKLRHVAEHDALTSLPNRAAFSEKLAKAVKTTLRDGSPVALMLFNVDHFKQINDLLGHEAGDALLRKLAENLASVVRSSDVVARVGGDEFAVLFTGLDTPQAISTLLTSLNARLNKPLRHRGRLIECRASIGIAQCPKDAKTPEALTRCSDLALASAKTTRGSVVIFEPHLRDDFDNRQRSVAIVKSALEDDALRPFYQPKVDLLTGAIVGFEALMRCELNGTFVSHPEVFDSGFLDKALLAQIRIRLTGQILDDVAAWKRAGVQFGRVAINSCAADFADGNFGENLVQQIEDRMLSPDLLELEVTEGVFVGRGAPHVSRALKLLCGAGMRIALDDFGTGFASLTHLKQFPVNVLKIDRSFVAGIGKSADDAAIVRAVIGLGKNLGIETVAEGIETFEQAAFVRKHGCDVGQGFLYGAAVPAREIPSMTIQNAKYEAA